MEEKIVKPTVSNIPVATPEPEVALPEPETSAKAEQVAKLTDVPNEQREVDVDTLIPSDPYYMDPLFYEVATFFGLEQGDYDAAKNKLADIVDFVIRDIKSNQPDEVLMALRKIERSLQPPAWDEKRYSNVHKYIRLAQKKSTISQAMKAFEK